MGDARIAQAVRCSVAKFCVKSTVESICNHPLRVLITLVLLGGSVMDGAASAQSLNGKNGLVLSNVTIVDTHTGKLTPKATIVIEGGKITEIMRSESTAAGVAGQRIDGHGKFVVPGYWDMHAHPFNNPNLKENLSLMLAYGITGVRQMAGSPELLKERREGKLVPSTPAPELLAMPGDLLLPTNAGTPKAAVAEVGKQKAEGADFIKTIQVSPDAFFASLAEAKRVGLPYEGHLSTGVSAAKASEAGMRSIEHLGAGEGMLVDCSIDEAAVRLAIAKLPALPSTAAAASGAEAILNQRIGLASPVLAAALSDPTYVSRVQHLIDTYSEAKCRQLAETFVAHQTWQAPTLIRLRTAAFADDTFYSGNPDLRYASPAAIKLWETVAQRYSNGLSPAAQETLHRMFAMQMKITRMFDQAGVKMLAGSDCGGSVWEVFGVSLHQEFNLLAQAGISPLKVLQMTTLNGAAFYGREATAGSVEEGRDADLLLLDGNPIESVENLHKIDAVIRAGTYYSRDALGELKQRAAEGLAAADSAGPANGGGHQ
jgi:imidazolonepropionase-like amidohydrolase